MKMRQLTVERYAEDVVENNELLDTKIVNVSVEDDVLEIAKSLEVMFYEENLVGAVFVGDVPLPVVNKNGNRFVSMLPYTDFIDPVFINENSDFVENPQNQIAFAEIWHGVIRGTEEEMRSFFNKNHSYYDGDGEYSDFENKLFYADLIAEEQQLNEDFIPRYYEYLRKSEDLAFLRYNKYWARDLMRKFGSGEVDMSEVPDIYTKDLIDKQLFAYFELFSRFNSDVNDLIAKTGRFDSTDADTMVGLISTKDEVNKEYLKNVNLALENRVDEVADLLDKELPLVKETKISVNASIPLTWRFNFYDAERDEYFINGVNADNIDSVMQCSVFQGSTQLENFIENLVFDPASSGGDYSILTRSLRSDNISTALPKYTGGFDYKLKKSEEYEVVAEVTGLFDNPLEADLRSNLQDFLPVGSEIISIGGIDVSATNTVDYILDDIVKTSEMVMKKEDIDQTPLSWNVFNEDGEELAREALPEFADMLVFFEVVASFDGNIQRKEFSFSPRIDDGKFELSNRGIDNVVMVLDGEFPENLSRDDALFGLYENGYRGNTYDSSAGCNFGVTNQNSDLCVGNFAKIPVFDTAGASDLKNIDGELQFENRARDDRENFVTEYEIDPTNIDEYFLNACYSGMLSNDFDGLEFGHPLIDQSPVIPNQLLEFEYYGVLYRQIRSFAADENAHFDEDVDPEIDLWAGVGNVEADDIYLDRAKIYTLADFANAEGLENASLEEIARKMFLEEGRYEIDGAVMTVNPVFYNDKMISTVVKHKEPTDETIMQQLQSGTTESLPIDNPRYVSFMDLNGEMKSFDYPNSFDADSIADFRADLRDLANRLALTDGMNAIEGNTVQEKANYIYEEYFSSVLDADSDLYVDQSLIETSALKLQDALTWNRLDLDSKHGYVFKKYLNQSVNENAYVADSSHFPDSNGYEVAYLVMDGEDNFIDLNFNKPDLEDYAPDPLGDFLDSYNQESAQEEAENADDDLQEDYEWVWLDQFLEELNTFVDGFSTVPNFEDV